MKQDLNLDGAYGKKLKAQGYLEPGRPDAHGSAD